LVRVKLDVWKLNRFDPNMSPGIRSGVNWMRPNSSPTARANACASSVFAVPGGPSSSTWPPASSAIVTMRVSGACPNTALATSPSSAAPSAATPSMLLAVTQQILPDIVQRLRVCEKLVGIARERQPPRERRKQLVTRGQVAIDPRVGRTRVEAGGGVQPP